MSPLTERLRRWLCVDEGIDLVTPDRRAFSKRPLPRLERIIIAAFIGIVTVYLTHIAMGNTAYGAKDWTYQWRAGQALVAGQNPYDVIRPAGGYPYESWYMYPFTAVLGTLPFSLFSIQLGGALFVGFGAAMLAYAVSRDGIGRLWLFASAPFYVTIILGQWAPLLMAGIFLTPLAWALTCKPTLGAALFAYRPSWRTLLVGGAFGLLALAVHPDWIGEWLRNAGTVPGHAAPVRWPLGWIPLLALLRWRRPEARLVGAMTVVPQVLFFYDQMPLLLAARSSRAAFGLAVLTWIGFAMTMRDCGDAAFCTEPSRPWALWTVYFPATLYVLADGMSPRELMRRLRGARGDVGSTSPANGNAPSLGTPGVGTT